MDDLWKKDRKRSREIILSFDFLLVGLLMMIFSSLGRTSNDILCTLIALLLFICIRFALSGKMLAGVIGFITSFIGFAVFQTLDFLSLRSYNNLLFVLSLMLFVDSYLYLRELSKTYKK